MAAVKSEQLLLFGIPPPICPTSVRPREFQGSIAASFDDGPCWGLPSFLPDGSVSLASDSCQGLISGGPDDSEIEFFRSGSGQLPTPCGSRSLVPHVSLASMVYWKLAGNIPATPTLAPSLATFSLATVGYPFRP